MEDLLDWVDDPDAGWSVGTFGALAEFLRDPDEPADVTRGPGRATAVTARGAVDVHLNGNVVPVAWERRSGDAWNQAVALCVPIGAGGRSVITELGPDTDATRAGDREDVLVDLGVGAPHLAACVRTGDAALLASLRAAAGRPLAEAGSVAAALVEAGPHRVFRTAAARLEVYTPIPPPTGASPEGPHTHLLPHLLAHGRTHAATDPIPPGRAPGATIHLPHPTRAVDGRRIPPRAERHRRAQEVLERYGDPAALAAKAAVTEALATSAEPPPWTLTRDHRATVELALRQMEELEPTHPHLEAWRARVPRERSESEGRPLTHDPAQG
ncbi:hypothetical protein Acsp06_21270 [Actinomycetospora sp. NBRC 106375]|uniref:DUF6925 family protein n=1 Tax=Actinomycetospora sp. NBRC 106375 TaxID=3032207 RepID=UPI0024A386CE|nr:hypothetical protein [Actinomycetospora sp. NBRC 106375]GLZ45942.1 hypothetical protein Acsp06_21270 [Actinomycetospora sp. NBRC 106375]